MNIFYLTYQTIALLPKVTHCITYALSSFHKQHKHPKFIGHRHVEHFLLSRSTFIVLLPKSTETKNLSDRFPTLLHPYV